MSITWRSRRNDLSIVVDIVHEAVAGLGLGGGLRVIILPVLGTALRALLDLRLHGDFQLHLGCPAVVQLSLSAIFIVVEVIDVAEIFEASVNVPDAHREVVSVGDELVLVFIEEPPTELDDALPVTNELMDRGRQVSGAPQHDDVLVLDPVLLRQRDKAVAERRVPGAQINSVSKNIRKIIK